MGYPFRWGMGIFRRSTFVRYVFSGGTAAAIDVVLLYALVTYLGVYYLAAATFAMTMSFIARFLLQKHVTFVDDNKEQEKKQFVYYSILYFASLAATNVLLYVFYEKMHIWLVLSQVMAILIIACFSFFVYKLIIFAKPSARNLEFEKELL